MTSTFAAVAIGGTNTSVAIATHEGDSFTWVGRCQFPTTEEPSAVMHQITTSLDRLLNAAPQCELKGVGIICGGPLDESSGLVLSPPNLPRWDHFDVVTPFQVRYGVATRLMNDANAGALAEWVWGAAKGAHHVIFLTMGTGLGAGLILGDRLHTGANGMAGEVGHWRLASDGPEGYGKAGSFEGFCSGGGIAQWAKAEGKTALVAGLPTSFAPTESDLVHVTAARLAEAAEVGDSVAENLWHRIGAQLGVGIALLIDLINPDVIVIGGIYARQESRLAPFMNEVIDREALLGSRATCRIVPAELGERISDYSGLAVGLIGDISSPTTQLLTAAVEH